MMPTITTVTARSTQRWSWRGMTRPDLSVI
jgi:hypothetical protein